MNNLIEVYGAKTGNCLRVAIALEEAELPYTTVPIDLRNGQQREATYISLNPAGKVPTIIDQSASGEAFVLTQSNAILFYLAEKVPEKLLPTNNLHEKAIAYERFFYFLTDVIASGHAAFRLRQADEKNASDTLDALAISMLCAAERFLAHSPFMAGASFTLADIAAFTITRAYEKEINWSETPLLEQWYKNVNARPTVQRGLQAF